MSNENLSILEEINEELKHDKQVEFLKKHKKIIISVISFIVLGILIHSSLHERKKKQMEDITNTLLNIVQSPDTKKNELMIAKMLEGAPAELKPILKIIQSGKQLILGESSEKTLDSLLELSKKHGVDLIWKDLALLIYASYSTKSSSELIKLLEPVVGSDRPFRFSVLELIGMIYENDGNHSKAIEYFDQIIADKEAPKTLKERISMLSSYIKNNDESTKQKIEIK